jgi:hypothetical protein
MILTTHILVGAALGKSIGNPWLVALIAIPLHFWMDHFRHGEYLDQNSKMKNIWWKIALDLFGGITIVATIAFALNFSFVTLQSIAIGVFFSALPDLTTLLYWKFHQNIFKKIYDFHGRCHRYPPSAKERLWTLRNRINDILFSVIAIALLIL